MPITFPSEIYRSIFNISHVCLSSPIAQTARRHITSSTLYVSQRISAYFSERASSFSQRFPAHWFVFHPFHKTASIIYPYFKSCNSTPKWLLIGVAFTVAAVASLVFSILSFPCRYMRSRYLQSLYQDICYLNRMERSRVKEEILAYIKDHCTQDIPVTKQNDYVEKITACYARSHHAYAPIVRAWTDYLLDTAHKKVVSLSEETTSTSVSTPVPQVKLVFMERDGLASFHLAQKLMEKQKYKTLYPLLPSKHIVRASLSRPLLDHSTVTEEDRALFQRYMKEEVGINPTDRLIFVDIGFKGSCVDKLKSLLPDNAQFMDFEFLISLTDKAHGFLGNPSHPFSSITESDFNPAVQWLEKAHQGNLERATHLTIVDDHIYPNTQIPGQEIYCPGTKQPNSLSFLARHFSMRAVLDSANADCPLQRRPLWKAKHHLNNILERIKSQKLAILPYE